MNAPHLTVDAVPLQASAFLVRGGPSCNFNFIQQWDSRTQTFSMADNAI